MSYGNEDLQRRAKVANELNRREFWKECFKIVLAVEPDICKAALEADAALSAFESRFAKEIK